MEDNVLVNVVSEKLNVSKNRGIRYKFDDGVRTEWFDTQREAAAYAAIQRMIPILDPGLVSQKQAESLASFIVAYDDAVDGLIDILLEYKRVSR